MSPEEYQEWLDDHIGWKWVSLKDLPNYPAHTIFEIVPKDGAFLKTHIKASTRRVGLHPMRHAIIQNWWPLKWFSDEDWFLEVSGNDRP